MVVLEKTLENPLNGKEIKPVNPKGNQPWIFIGRTDTEAEALVTWCEELTHWKSPWCWERLKAKGEGETEDEMVRWHHWLNGHESEQILGDDKGQRTWTCCSPWGCNESDRLGDWTTTITYYWANGFWPWRPVDILWPSFDKSCSTRKLIFPWSVFSLYF